MRRNAPSILEWNLDKHYLQDLEAEGIGVVPTAYLSQGSALSLAEVMAHRNWGDVVVKPAIAGGAYDTYRVTQTEDKTQTSPEPPMHEGSESLWRALLAKQDMLIQPFLHDVVESGEISLIWIDGEVTHGVWKKAKKDDFRVQDDFGGTVSNYYANNKEINFAERVVKTLKITPAYARVDVIVDKNEQLALSELELIEPELWFRKKKGSSDLLAGAIKKKNKI